MDKIYLGFKVREFLPGLETKPISKVEILNDNGEIVGEAGDNSGQTLTATNPDGSNEMATSILEAVEGFVYKPFSANDAIIDPSAELGDGISVAGMYSTLIQSNIDFSGGMVTANISAPINDEIEDEYPYISPIERQIQRNYAATKSIISKTTEEILLEVEALDESVGQTLRIAKDGVTITNADGDTLTIDGGQIDASKIKTQDLNLTGVISFGDFDNSTQEVIEDVATIAENAESLASSANSKAQSAQNQIAAWSYGGTTYIDGSKLYTGTVRASVLEGGLVSLLNYYGYTVGTLSMTGSSSADYAIELDSGGALRLLADNGSAYLAGGSSSVTCGNGNVYALASGGGYVLCSGDRVTLGPTAYLSSGAAITSDRNKKHDIQYMDEPDYAEIALKYDGLLDSLRLTRFKYNDGTSDRYHTALIANDVEEALSLNGLTSREFAGFCRVPVYGTDNEGNPTNEIVDYTCALRYDEFIGLVIRRAQNNTKEIAALKEENAELKSRLLTIEEKLTKMGV